MESQDSIIISLHVSLFRFLVLNMEEFFSQGSSVQWHIPHEYSLEMSKKSEIVCLECNAIKSLDRLQFTGSFGHSVIKRELYR